MAGYSNPYPPDWKQQRRVMREQERLQRAQMRAQARAQRDIYRMQRRAMRRGSIVGPLALIAIGVVFLLVQIGRLQGFHVWQWYGHWWPLILLIAGVIVLGEWAFDRFLASPDRPMLHRGLGGGLWVLFIFVIFTGTAASHTTDNSSQLWPGFMRWATGINNDNWTQLFGNLHERDQSFDQVLPAGAALTVTSPRGGVNIAGTSTDGQVHIQLRREIYTNSESEADDKARQLTPRFDTFGSQVNLSLPTIEGTQTGMTITVPPSTPLNITTSHGSIDVANVNAPITVGSTNGDINVAYIKGAVNARITSSGSSFRANNITGTVLLDTSGHDITITDVVGSATVRSGAGGTTHFERITGNASYHSDRTQFDATRLDGQFDTGGNHITVDSAVGPVSLRTSSYDIVLQRIGGNANISNSNGSIDLSSAPPLGNVIIDNLHGDVTVTVPEHASFAVEGTIRNHGEIFSDFNLTPQDRGDHGSSVHATVGTGGPVLHINTDRGNITLRKSDMQPLPATAPPVHASAPMVPRPAMTDARYEVRQSAAETRAAVREAAQEVRASIAETKRELEEARREVR